MESPAARPTAVTHSLVRELRPQVGAAISVGTITALVGPARSGKSELLRDIVRLAAGFEPQSRDHDTREKPRARILKDLTLAGKLTVDRLVFGLTRLATSDDSAIVVRGLGPDLHAAQRMEVGPEIRHVLQRPVITTGALNDTPLGTFMKLRVSYLGADQRAHCVGSSETSNPLRVPDGLLQALHEAPAEVHQQLDQAFGSAFNGLHLRLDDSQRLELALRASDRFPERCEDAVAEARAWNQLPQLEEQGHTCLHYTAVVLTLLLCAAGLL